MASTHDEQLWQRVQQLSAAVLAISADQDLERVLQQVADSSRAVLRARYAALGILDGSGKRLGRFVVSGVTREEYARIGDLPTGRGLLGVLIDDPRPLRLRNLGDDERAAGFPPHHPPMRSFLGVPILGPDGPIGNLYLTEKKNEHEFTAEDEAIAVMFAAHAAVALENARRSTERELLLDEVRAMTVSRDRFFAMINHEVRNSLTAVHGWAELWLRRAGPEPPRAAREVMESAERAVRLVEDVLDLSKLDADRLQLQFEDAEAWEIAQQAISSVEPVARRESVPIEVGRPETPVSCRTDPARVRQILINLLTNAIRHSPPGAPVRVTLAVDGPVLRYEVADRGEGIAADALGSIFEAFERAGRDSQRGTGLGLAVSRKLARRLGGELRVESRTGEGARFTLDVPRTAPRS